MKQNESEANGNSEKCNVFSKEPQICKINQLF